eukprot:Clim_evm40s7 gene=Clim_evmTU40s7
MAVEEEVTKQPAEGTDKPEQTEDQEKERSAEDTSEQTAKEGNSTTGGKATDDGDKKDDDNKEGSDKDEDDDEDADFGVLAEQKVEIIVPSYSAWFNYNSVDNIEKRALPEFFSGKNRSKTPEIYMAYRNFMIDTYRLNPTEYLNFTACRRNLVGDVCAIARVHAFLEQWGLINYQVDADSVPAPLGPPSTAHFHVSLDVPSGLQPLRKAKEGTAVSVANGTSAAAPEANGEAEGNGEQEAVAGDADQPKSNGTLIDRYGKGLMNVLAVYCDNCGKVCRAEVYQHKTERTRICDVCYGSGKYGVEAQASDFVKQSEPAGKDRAWSEGETLRLLEGIAKCGTDWTRVAEYVGTRTQDECILHFVRLPIEDEFREGTDKDTRAETDLTAPFSTAENPVMAVVAYLVANVEPALGATAAEAAMREFSKATGQEAESTAAKEVVDAAGEAVTKKAAVAAMAAAATRARALALAEDRKIHVHLAKLVEAQTHKVEAKLAYLEKLQEFMEQERDSIERQRRELYQERIALQKEKLLRKEDRARSVDALSGAGDLSGAESTSALKRPAESLSGDASAPKNIKIL